MSWISRLIASRLAREVAPIIRLDFRTMGALSKAFNEKYGGGTLQIIAQVLGGYGVESAKTDQKQRAHAKSSEITNYLGEKIFASSRKEKNGKVPLNSEVIIKCKCGICPVQSLSACSTPELQKIINSRAEVYCSVGYAGCKDLDNTKDCICNQCQVYIDFNLAEGDPKDYFCFNGKAINSKE